MIGRGPFSINVHRGLFSVFNLTKMAMFLPETAATAAMKSVGATESRIAQATTLGPPTAPAVTMSIGNTGVSFMPSHTPPPTAIGSTPTPYMQINPRKQVLLEKNPRIGLHYSVTVDDEMPERGELCFLDTRQASGWTHPRLLTLSQWASELKEAKTLDEAKSFIQNVCPVGVFNSDEMDVKIMRNTAHVALNVQRHATMNDYWPLDVHAGDRLWIRVSNTSKRSRSSPNQRFMLDIDMVVARSEKLAEKNTGTIALICVGVAQNRLPPMPQTNGYRSVRYGETRVERQRETHLTLNDCVSIY